MNLHQRENDKRKHTVSATKFNTPQTARMLRRIEVVLGVQRSRYLPSLVGICGRVRFRSPTQLL